MPSVPQTPGLELGLQDQLKPKLRLEDFKPGANYMLDASSPVLFVLGTHLAYGTLRVENIFLTFANFEL